MSYKTILVHVDQSRHAPARIKLAAQLALADNAHLIGAAMSGISRFVYQNSAIGYGAPIVVTDLDFLTERANSALAEFDAIASSIGVLSYEKRLIDDEPDGGLALQARYCDLVVVGQTDPDEPTVSLISDLPEYLMLHCARPVLIVPHAGQFDRIGNHPLVAWDGSMEATRAITNAIPLLKRANNVSLVLFNPGKQYQVHGEQPGVDIALYLARHGIEVTVVERGTEIDVGNALLSLAADLGSDLIVMGGYGHTRFREVLLGGATVTILKAMTVPILMSH